MTLKIKLNNTSSSLHLQEESDLLVASDPKPPCLVVPRPDPPARGPRHHAGTKAGGGRQHTR